MSKTPQRGFTLRRVSYRSAYNGITQRVLVWGTTYSRMNVAEITYYPKPYDWMNGCRWAAYMTYSGSGATFATLGEAREYCERRFVDEVLKYRKEGMMSLQVELVGEPVLIQGHLFFKSAPAPEFGIGDGVFYRSDGADWLIAPWGASDPAEVWPGNASQLWLFMRGNDGRSNPEWRSIREVNPNLPPNSKSNLNDKIYADLWEQFNG